MMAKVLSEVSQGIVDGRCEAGGFRIELGKHRPGGRFPVHAHRHPNLLYVLNGRFEQRIGERVIDVGAGIVVEKPGGILHEDRLSAGPTQILYVEVLPPRLPEVTTELALFQEPRWYPGGKEVAALARRIIALFRGEERPQPLILEALAIEFLVAASAAALAWRSESLSLESAVNHLEARLPGPTSVADLASQVGEPPAQLVQAFEDRYGEHPLRFVRRRRLEEAARLLATSTKGIATIAHDLGFSDQAHLTRQFHRTFGLPPARYREEMRL